MGGAVTNELAWLFDEQGRMRDDLPPLIYPYGRPDPFTIAGPKPQAQPQNGFNNNDLAALVERLVAQNAPLLKELKDAGLDIEYKRWGNPDGTPFNGLMLWKSLHRD